MKRFSRAISTALAAAWATSSVSAAGVCPTASSYAFPRTKPEQWFAEHEAIASKIGVSSRYIMMGDSITAGWPDDLSSQIFNGASPVVAGIKGDTVPNMIWRTERLALTNARAITFMGGVNDLLGQHRSPEEVVSSIMFEVSVLHQRAPKAQLIFFKILPTGYDPFSAPAQSISATNLLIDRCLPKATWLQILDLAPALAESGLPAPNGLLPDRVHPNRTAYEQLTKFAKMKIEGLLKSRP